MKKALSLFMVFILACSLIACTDNEKANVKIEKRNDLYEITINNTTYAELAELGTYKSKKADSNIKNVWVYGKNSGEPYNPVLVVETKDSLLATTLVECATYYPSVYIGDVNGDADEEIIVNNVRTAMGIGEYKLQVFQAKDELVSIYAFPKTDYIYNGPDADIPYDELNFGFTGELLDNYQLLIKFPSLNYQRTITLESNKTDSSFFDENGTVKNKNENVLKFSTFSNVEVADVDNDGVCEIIGSQNVSYGVIKSIGSVNVVLKYQQTEKTFKPVQVEFVAENELKKYEYAESNGAIEIISHEYNDTETPITIPNYINCKPVTIIRPNAFYQHKRTSAITLPDSITAIVGSPFYRCYSITEFLIPSKVDLIDGNPFFRCPSLTKIEVDSKNTYFSSQDGVLFNYDKTTLVAYPEGKTDKTYTIPKSVTKICGDAFGYYPLFKELVIYANVTEFPTHEMFIFPDNILLHVEKDSKAEEYAIAKSLNYKLINDSNTPSA